VTQSYLRSQGASRLRVLLIIVAVILAVGLVLSADMLILGWGTRSPEAEAERMAALAGVAAGHTIAEIGAGGGEMLRVLAPKTLPNGRVFVTELDEENLSKLRALVDAQRWTHVSVLSGVTDGTALPDACCSLIYMRHVYHHFGDRRVMGAALRRALAPGGKLVVIDFEPVWLLSLIAPVPGNTDGHGITAEHVIADLTAAGLTLIDHDTQWTAGSFMTMFGAPGLQ
jgi:ubiquinone/menaquinone biosynthesis C-methylase UbiE